MILDLRLAALAAAAVTLPGCAAHVPPPPPAPLPAPASLTTAATPVRSATGPSQTFAVQGSVPGRWWTLFGSAKLDALVARALIINADIATAEANLRQARELASAAGGARLPQLDTSYQAQRARTSAALSPPTAENQLVYTLHTAQLSASYSPDLFGGARGKIASARATAEVQRHRLTAARTTVVTNLIAAAVQHASDQRQLEAIETNVRVNREVLALMRRRQVLGAIGAADLAAQETALGAAQAAASPVHKDLAHQAALISQLSGVAPGTQPLDLPRLEELHLPQSLPLLLPADVVRRRPDVLAAEAQMTGAAAELRTAIAARLPNITLSANLGGAAGQISQMFAGANPFWALIGGVTQPLFHGGALRHQQRASEAALAAAQSQFRAAVIQAFVEVTDALTALHTDAEALDAASQAERAAGRNLAFARRQQSLGDVGTLTLLNAVSAHAQAELQVTQARAQRLADTAALLQALGGGWEAP